MTPKPSEVLGVEGQQGVPADQGKYTADEWLSWTWESQVGAITNPVQCWVCGFKGAHWQKLPQ
eukprot:3191267-Karenia_brevis.AAC.1